MTKKLYLLLFLAAALQMGLNAQHSLNGTIYDKNSGETLPGAHIVLEDTYLTAISGPDGTFSFNLNFRLGAPDGTSEDYFHTECPQLSYSSEPLPPVVNTLGSLGAVLKAYPNPTTGEMVNLQIDNLPAEGEFVTIELTDVFGHVFPLESFTNDDVNSLRTLTFDQPLNNGVYIITVKYNGLVETQRIVISK